MELKDYMSVTFSKEQKQRLAPFLIALTVFFLLYLPVWSRPAETLGAAFFKMLPIWCLVLFVSAEANGWSLSKLPALDKLLPDDEQASHVIYGLLFSSLGDACLVWRKTLFLPGVLAFAMAHVMYLNGISLKRGRESRTVEIFVLFGINVFLMIQPGIDSYIMKLVVGIYVCLICGMAWKATARFEETRSKASLAGCVGALVFVFSDVIIAVDKWCFFVPFWPLLVTTSYYAAQFCLAISTSKDLNLLY